MENHPKKDPLKKPKPPLNDFAKYSSISVKMILIVLGGAYGGMKLDEKFGLETPIFTLILSLLAVALAMYVVIRDVSK